MQFRDPLSQVGLFAAVIIVLTVILSIAAEEIGKDAVSVELATVWMGRLFGMTLLLMGAFEMVRLSYSDGSRKRFADWIIVLLAGALLISQHWSAALALGAIGVVIIVTQGIPRKKPVSTPEEPPESE